MTGEALAVFGAASMSVLLVLGLLLLGTPLLWLLVFVPHFFLGFWIMSNQSRSQNRM